MSGAGVSITTGRAGWTVAGQGVRTTGFGWATVMGQGAAMTVRMRGFFDRMAANMAAVFDMGLSVVTASA
jgi:hypothetical protein